MERILKIPGGFKVGWSPEIPLSKIYAALKWGESLSSMSIRINDSVALYTSPHHLQSVDVLQDPIVH
jgi:hypothetical protein